MEINDNYKKDPNSNPKGFLRKARSRATTPQKVEESRTQEDINQGMSEKRMRCLRAQR